MRKILRAYRTFDPTDVETATFLIDLRDVIGFNPMVSPAITDRQRQVIQTHLIDDRDAVEAAKMLGISRWTMWTIESDGLKAILGALQGQMPPQRIKAWRPWQIALLFDGKLTLPELATKIGKSELAVKLMMSRLRKQNEAVPFRRRFSRRTATGKRSEQ